MDAQKCFKMSAHVCTMKSALDSCRKGTFTGVPRYSSPSSQPGLPAKSTCSAPNRQLMDLNLLQGHAYKLTLSWLIIYYNYFMTSTAWTLPVLTYSVLGEVPPAVQRRVVPARLPWSKSPHRKLSASAWASNKVGCSNRKKTLHSSRSFHLAATNI